MSYQPGWPIFASFLPVLQSVCELQSISSAPLPVCLPIYLAECSPNTPGQTCAPATIRSACSCLQIAMHCAASICDLPARWHAVSLQVSVCVRVCLFVRVRLCASQRPLACPSVCAFVFGRGSNSMVCITLALRGHLERWFLWPISLPQISEAPPDFQLRCNNFQLAF